MNLSIIGSGNIAHFFAEKCLAAQHAIECIVSKNEVTGNALAKNTGANFSANFKDCKSETILLAIPDDAILEIIQDPFFDTKRIIHTSGSIGLKELKSNCPYISCLWPIYSIQKNNLPTRQDIPFMMQSSNENARRKTVSLAKCLTNNLTEVNDEQKAVLHLSAVLVNNFTNHLFHISENLLRENNISFDVLKPIIEETVENIMQHSPANVQTGPAIRNDQSTLQKHIDLLSNDAQKEIYKNLSDSIRTIKKD